MSTGKFSSPGSPLLRDMSDLFIPSIYFLTGICLLLSVISGTAVFTSPVGEFTFSFIIFMLSVAGLMMSKSPRAFESINRIHLMTFFAVIMSGILIHMIGGIIVLIWVFSDDGNAGKIPADGFFYGPLICYIAFHGMVIISSIIMLTLSISGFHRENNNLYYKLAASGCKYLIGIFGIAASVCAIVKAFIDSGKLGSQWALYYIQIVSISLIGFGIFVGIIVGVLIYRRLSKQSRMIPYV